jgi:hypothetical protein
MVKDANDVKVVINVKKKIICFEKSLYLWMAVCVMQFLPLKIVFLFWYLEVPT